MKRFSFTQLLSLMTIFVMMLAVAVSRDGRLFGLSLVKTEKIEAEEPVTRVTPEGQIILNTKNIARSIIGYGGPIPLNLIFEDAKLVEIELQDNAETPSFIEWIVEEGFLNEWDNLTPEQILYHEVDVISGATMTTEAIIHSVHIAANYLLDNPHTFQQTVKLDIRFWAVLLVVLSGMIVPVFLKKKKRFRTVQLLLNVAVLGFWSGTFISLSLLTSYLSNGLNILVAIIPVLLMVAAFIMPLFGKTNHYCNWLCPMGSAQELTAKLSPFKIRLSAKAVKYLTYFRNGLWYTMMFLMWIGVGFELMDYEVFSVFLFKTASLPVIIIAVVFVLLSAFMSLPYCRFVCPTGTLLKHAQRK